MLISRLAIGMIQVGLVLSSGAAFSQNYPSKPIRIVTTGVGGGADLISRVIAQGVSGGLGQAVIVENRSGILTIETVVKAPADGYTLLLYGSAIWLTPFIQKNVSYDPVRDLAPISLTDTAPNVLIVHPSLPVKSVRNLIDLAKAKPGELNFSSGPIGSSSHLAAELFKSLAGVNIMRIPYKISSQESGDLIAGYVQFSFATPAEVMPYVKSGRLRALAVGSLQPSALVPGLPAVGASVPGFESVSIHGMFAPAKTPEAIIKRLNQTIAGFLNTAEAKAQLFKVGVESVGNSPEQFAALMKSEMAKWGKLIKDAGIQQQ